MRLNNINNYIKTGTKCFLIKKKKKIITFIIYLQYVNYKIWFVNFEMKTHTIVKEKKKYGSLLKMINFWAINLENIRE